MEISPPPPWDGYYSLDYHEALGQTDGSLFQDPLRERLA